MARYKNTKIKKDKRRNVTVRSTTLYEEVPKRNDDIYVIAQDGDRLDNLAYKYYNDASLWWVIAQANELGKGRTILNPNFQIRIPGNITTIIANFNALNE